MYPVVHIGSMAVSSFSVAMLLAFLLAVCVGLSQARFVGVDPHIVWQILPWGAVAGLAGARLYSLVWHLPQVLHGEIAWSSLGEVWYGGLIGGVAAAAWRFRQSGMPLYWLFDYGAAPVALGHMIGRVGCFLVGDDYGQPTSGPLGVIFPHSVPPTTAASLRAQGVALASDIPGDTIVAVFPAQLFEAIALLGIGLWLYRVSRRPHRPWGVFMHYALLYGVWRFCIEFIRVKDDRLPIGLTSAQLVSVALVVCGVALSRRRVPLEPAPPVTNAALASVAAS